jgi:hypothetical protein
MTHKKFENLLQLSRVQTLDEQNAALLASHLAECPECRKELSALEKLEAGAARLRERIPVDDTLLQECRRELHVLLHHEATSRQTQPRLFSLLGLLAVRRGGLAFALVLALAVGIGAGRLLFPGGSNPAETHPVVSTASLSQPPDRQPRITNVQFLDRGEGTDVVEFTFDAVTPVRMRGKLDDPSIQKVLVSAMLNDDNPGVRLRAISAISAAPAPRKDKEIESALIRALKTDPNVGVRKQAITVLRGMPLDAEIRQALLCVLMNEKNPGLRIAAINALEPALNEAGTLDQRIRDVLRQKANSDNNDYVRLKAKAVLLEKQ